MQCFSSYTLQTLKPTQQNSLLQTNTTGNTIEGILVIYFFCSLTLLFLCKKYRAYRTTRIQLQIATLEKLWKISPKK